MATYKELKTQLFATLEPNIRKLLEIYRDCDLIERNRMIKSKIDALFKVAVSDSRWRAQGRTEQQLREVGEEIQQFIDAYFSKRLPVDRAPNRLTITLPDSYDIERALCDVLTGEREGGAKGCVVFRGENKMDFVQYSMNKYGFLLFWPPTLGRFHAVLSVLEAERFELVENDFGSTDTVQLVQELRKGFMACVNGKLFAQAGTDVDFVKNLTGRLLREVIGFKAA